METKQFRTTLPRSIRWRINLGLLQNTEGCKGYKNNEKIEEENKNTVVNIGDAYDDELSSLESKNYQLILSQRKQYDKLADKHYRNSSAIEIIHDTDKVKPFGSSSGTAKSNSNNSSQKQNKNVKLQKVKQSSSSKGPSVNVMNEDPLSVFAQIEELKVKSEKEKEMEIRKERALASRTQYSIAQQYHASDPSKKIMSTPSSSSESISGGDSFGQHRWSEFYSSREVMDIIEKDVDRLPTDHQVAAFYSAVNAHKFDHQGQSKFELKEQLGCMNQRIQKEASSSSENDHYHEIMKFCRQQRSRAITQILFVYAKEYPKLGYRQGMHEILSLIYLCLEIDLLSVRDQDKKQTQYDQEQFILDSSKIAHDSFSIFQAIMSLLCPAFEVRDIDNDSSSNSSTSPMELIGKHTIDKIRIMASDEELYQFVSSMSIPPELYCTRWIRLMFSRDVKGLDNVMILWDEFFHLVSKATKDKAYQNNVSDNVSSPNELMNVLEITAASMIIMIRPKLIPTMKSHQLQQMGVYQEDEDDHDPNDCIHLLMNYDSIEDVTDLIKVIDDMISGNINVSTKSPQITMENEINDDTQIHDNHTAHAHQYHAQGNYSMDQSHMMISTEQIPQNYGADTQNISNLAQYSHDANYQHNVLFYNPATAQDMRHGNPNQYEGPVMFATDGNNNYSQDHYDYVPQHQAHQSKDAIQSTIENIAGNDAWKKLSGGLSGGIIAVKGALGTLDYTMQNLTSNSNNSTTTASYLSSSNNFQQNHDNVYNSSRQKINKLSQSADEGFRSSINPNNPLMNDQYRGPESIYDPGYRDLDNETFEPIHTAQTNKSVGTTNQSTKQMEVKPTVASLSNDDNLIISMEGQFVGCDVGGNVGKIRSDKTDELSLLADKLEQSLLTLSSYLQNHMAQTTNGTNPIPSIVWNAMAEIEAVKNELKIKEKNVEK